MHHHELFRRGDAHEEQRVFDVRQRRREAEIKGRVVGSFSGLSHQPTNQVAEHELGMDFLEDAGRRVGTEVLNVQSMLPFAVDGFDRPTSVVEVDEFVACVAVGVGQRGEQPSWAEAGDLIADQTGGEFARQTRRLPSRVRRGMERDKPLVWAACVDPLGKFGRLV